VTAEHLSLGAKMTAFAKTFHALGSAPGVFPWDANQLDAWAASGVLSHGELVTARFVLAIWDPNHPWRCGRFDLMDAMGIWDGDHRRAFLAWAADPWWL
jgi:hypothetical protein